MTVPITALGYHVGIVVDDREVSVSRYRDLLGASIGTFEYTKPAQRLPRPWPETQLLVAYCRAGGMTLELIQPVDRKGIFGAFLDQHGEGVQHLGFWVPDVPASVRTALELGATLTSATITTEGNAVVSLAGLTADEIVPMVGPNTAFVDLDAGPEIEFVGVSGVASLRALLGDALEELAVLPPWVPPPSS
jgi:catechol 2,3-dioxygenase-like lactoylglutathione lyase family enzyme